jgi:hypothetical protein
MSVLTREQFKIPKYMIPLFNVSAWSGFSNQPDGDAVEIVSNNANDTGLLTIFGKTKTTGQFKYETVTLKGTTVVTTSELDWDDIYGVFLGNINGRNIKPAVGTIVLKEASHGQTITTLTTGRISTGMVGFDLRGYNITIIHASGNLYFTQGEIATTDNGYPLSTGEKLKIKTNELFYLISDTTGATSKIFVYEN